MPFRELHIGLDDAACERWGDHAVRFKQLGGLGCVVGLRGRNKERRNRGKAVSFGASGSIQRGMKRSQPEP